MNNSMTLNLILGVFLKLLGFFVVLYSLADIDMDRARQVETSLKERFNVSISLAPELSGNEIDEDPLVTAEGRALEEIGTAMKSQVDFLSSEYDAHSHVLILRVPATIAMDIGTQLARSPDFTGTLVQTLATQKVPHKAYQVEAIVHGDEKQSLMQSISLFVQKLVARRYDADLLTIGYQHTGGTPMLELRIRQVSA